MFSFFLLHNENKFEYLLDIAFVEVIVKLIHKSLKVNCKFGRKNITFYTVL